MTVYLDGVMGLNFLVDWLLLLGVNRISGFPPGFGRTAAAAALGGGYAGACLVPGWGYLSSGVFRAISLGLISLAAFGPGRGGIRRGVLFVLLSMALGGLALTVGAGGFRGIPGCAGALGLLCRLGFRGKPGTERFQTVFIRHREKTVRLTAFSDTGNALRDPVTGEPVLVVDRDIGEKLLNLSQEQLASPETVLAERPGEGFRLIPYQTIASEGGLLLALRCEEVTVGGRKTGGLVGFAPARLGDGTYSALTGG